jgi:hypothetical protein
MAKQNKGWQTLSLKPLIGLLDVRSRPADIPAGGFRWRLNLSCSDEGKACRRDGFGRAFPDLLFDNAGVACSAPGTHLGCPIYHNADLHHQGGTREPINMLFEATADDSTRSLFAGTDTRLYTLNEQTGYWTTIGSGLNANGSSWKSDILKNTVIFSNTNNNIRSHVIGSGVTNTIPDLIALGVSKARVVIQYAGFMFLMNFDQTSDPDTNGNIHRHTRIRWCDLNLPLSWAVGAADSLADFQDLPYGDDILAAIPLLGSIYIFTRRSIWKMTVNPNPATSQDFAFVQVYTEPKNQTGCLTYPNTLVTDGQNIWYMSKEGIYHYNPWLAAPERDDWLHKASGVIYKKADTSISGVDCESPVAEYRPSSRELWISWPSGGRTINNWTLISQLEQKAADVMDHGFTVIRNYRRTPVGLLCNESQSLLAVSGRDWAIKDIGGVFYREFLALDPSGVDADLPATSLPAVYTTEGFATQVRGLIPTGLHDREKIIRSFLLDHDTSEQDTPCIVRLRIGNSFHLADPNDLDDTCAVQWRFSEDLPLSCPDGAKISQMSALNQRPSDATTWPMYEMGRFLYFELTILNADKTPAIGGDTCLERFDFDLMADPKP